MGSAHKPEIQISFFSREDLGRVGNSKDLLTIKNQVDFSINKNVTKMREINLENYKRGNRFGQGKNGIEFFGLLH
jgi:hypothetical protein